MKARNDSVLDLAANELLGTKTLSKPDNWGKGKTRCKECGYRIRGKVKDHESGTHHKTGRNRG
jgi:hypothetical protein